jgi:hypothetical protein
VRLTLQLDQDPVPHCPTGRNATKPLPPREMGRQVTPRRARSKPPADRLHHLPVIDPPATTTRLPSIRQQRFDPGLDLIRQHPPATHVGSLPRSTAKIRQTRPDMWGGLSSGHGEAAPAMASSVPPRC